MSKPLISVFLVCLSVLWIIAFFYYQIFAPRKCSGDDCWDRLLRASAFIVKEDSDSLEIGWRGRHGVDFYYVRKADADRAYISAVKRHFDYLISRTGFEVNRFGKASDQWSGDLAIITGQNFGTDWVQWRQWWKQARESYMPPPELYQKLDRLKVDRELERGHPSPLLLRNRVTVEYRKHRPWSRALLASLVLPTVVALLLCWKMLRSGIGSPASPSPPVLRGG